MVVMTVRSQPNVLANADHSEQEAAPTISGRGFCCFIRCAKIIFCEPTNHRHVPNHRHLQACANFAIGRTTLAHQELHQLQSDPKVASAVATHPCTRIVFRVGDDDAKKLGEGFESFDATSLKTLAQFHAIARVERNDFDFNLALRKPDLRDYTDARKAAVIAVAR
jgi:hypothetical protein